MIRASSTLIAHAFTPRHAAVMGMLTLCATSGAFASITHVGANFDELAQRSPFGKTTPAALATTENREGEEAFEYRGVYEANGARRHSIRHLPSGTAAWLAAGEELNGLLVLANGDEAHSVKVRIAGRETVLSLPKTHTRAIASEEYGAPQIVSLLPGAPASAATSRIRHAQAMQGTGGASAPVAPVAANNAAAVSTAAATMAAENVTTDMPDNSPAEAKDAPRYTFKMGRNFNRVNSRIYASDHIAEHGAPPANPAP